MVLEYISQLLVSLVIVRGLASAIESFFLVGWYLKGEREKFVMGYWTAFHILAVWIMIFTMFRFIPDQTASMTASLITFAILSYLLLFFVPAYRSEVLFTNRLAEELSQKKADENTGKVIRVFQTRRKSAILCLVAFFGFLIARFLMDINDPFAVPINWLYTTLPWLYWILAGIAAAMFIFSAILGVQMLYYTLKRTQTRREMESKIGRKLTKEEFAYLYLDKQREEQAKKAGIKNVKPAAKNPTQIKKRTKKR